MKKSEQKSFVYCLNEALGLFESEVEIDKGQSTKSPRFGPGGINTGSASTKKSKKPSKNQKAAKRPSSNS